MFIKMFLVVAIIAAILGATSANTIRVLRSDLTIDDKGVAKSGAMLVDSRRVQLRDFAVCMRFNIKYLHRQEMSSDLNTTPIVHVSSWTNDTEELGKVWYRFSAGYPRSFMNFGYPLKSGSFHSWVIRDGTSDEPKIWSTNTWTHVCFSYEKSNSFVKVVKDGKMMSLNNSDKRVENAQLEADMLQNVHIGRCTIRADRECSALGGKFTDLNFWDRPLTDREMKDFTTCSDMNLKGNLVNWNLAEFQLDNMTEIDEPIDSVCKPKRPGDVLMLEKNDFLGHIDHCKKMGGRASVFDSRNKQEKLLSDRDNREMQGEGICSGNVWSGYWDETEEGNYVYAEDESQILGSFSPWAPGEPNGYKGENCVVLKPNGNWMDIACSIHACGFCQLEREPLLKVRGLCEESYFDYKYSWTGETINGKFAYYGITNSILFFDSLQQEWTLRLQSSSNNSTFASIKGEKFPFGTKKWEVFGDSCKRDEDGNFVERYEVDLNLNHCLDNEFNCEEGTCIALAQRCDGTVHCPDCSDEVNCETFILDDSYLKFMPPPTETDESLFPVKMSVDVLHVLGISEVENFIHLQLRIHMTWNDERLLMFNLKSDRELNSMTLDLRRQLWLPEIIFFNTDQKFESLNDEKTSAVVQRNGSSSLAPMSILLNGNTFGGAENAIILSRVYNYKYLCDFDMGAYPFDAQNCSAVFILKGNMGKFVELVPEKLDYIGRVELTQYFVKASTILESKVLDGVEGVRIELIFARRLLSTFLTTYLPTIMICMVSFTTNFYKSFFFEAIVTVNLTSMLLLVTLFISVSESLPKTAYIKYIDIWLIFVLFVPFLEVVLHTLIDNLRLDMERDNKYQSSVQEENSAKKEASARDASANRSEQLSELYLIEQKRLEQLRILLNVARFGMPALFLAFAILYYVYGIMIYNGILG